MARHRCRALRLLPVAAASCWLFGGLGFLPAGRHAGRAPLRHVRQAGMPDSLKETNKEIMEIAFPPEKMWQTNEAGTVLREIYPGARDFTSVFWAIVQPAASAGFLIVGISAYFGEPIVNWNPVTKELLPFLTDLTGINWIPQGIFMSFYGFFGLFLFGPLQWYLVGTNKGEGVAEFNKQTKRLTVIRDGEMIHDVPFDDIQTVKMEWTNLAAFGAREIFVVRSNGDEVHFMDGQEELPKRILEKRAAELADFVGKDLEVDDY